MAMNWAHDEEPKGVPAYAPGAPDSESDTAASNIPLISPLHRAMELNPSLRIIVMTGMYDGAGRAHDETKCHPECRGIDREREYEMGDKPILADLDPVGEPAFDHVPAEPALGEAEQ